MNQAIEIRTMPRLRGFDYRRPYFYMVTIKALKSVRAFSRILADGAAGDTTRTAVGEAGLVDVPRDSKGRPKFLELTDFTPAFSKIIRGFHLKFRGLAPIETFMIMPDHLHILFKIEETGDQFALGKYVYQLEKALAREYWRILADGAAGDATPTTAGSARRALAGETKAVDATPRATAAGQSPVEGAPSPDKPAPIFAPDWHDWIVKKKGQLAAFTRYIRENPRRAWLRRRNHRYFAGVRKVEFLGREWFAYGNAALLELPILRAIKGHRTTRPDSPEWRTMVEACSRLGEGCAGVSTFMSPLEKVCGEALDAAGGARIVLWPEGFRERWHPGREYEARCAEGRVLFLSLYDAMGHVPTRSELYQRCHEMGDIAEKALCFNEEGEK